VAVVLKDPQNPENVGAAARAAANTGLGRLILVNPAPMTPEMLHPIATRCGRSLIDQLTVYDTLEEALADFHFVAGTTARLGSHRGPFHPPKALGEKIAEMGPDVRVALVFGPERSGLTTPDLRLCHTIVNIPTADPKSSSLNLAQAVLILGYEIMLAAHPAGGPKPIQPAPHQELQTMYRELNQTLLTIGFLPDENTDHWLMSFKKIFNRGGLTQSECNLLRGLCRQIHWALNNVDKIKK
jgi:tRNA/rRNA methyltransferase